MQACQLSPLLILLFLAPLSAFAQIPGYQINEGEAEGLVDDVKDRVIPLAKEGVTLSHSIIYRIVKIFMPENDMITPEFVNAMTIVITIVAVVGIWMKLSTHFQKILLIIIILALVIFVLWPVAS